MKDKEKSSIQVKHPESIFKASGRGYKDTINEEPQSENTGMAPIKGKKAGFRRLQKDVENSGHYLMGKIIEVSHFAVSFSVIGSVI